MVPPNFFMRCAVTRTRVIRYRVAFTVTYSTMCDYSMQHGLLAWNSLFEWSWLVAARGIRIRLQVVDLDLIRGCDATLANTSTRRSTSLELLPIRNSGRIALTIKSL